MTSLKKLLPALALGIAAIPAFAGDEPALDKADTAWIMVAGLLVLFMTIPGIALFYAGMVRKKNMLSTLAQSVAICGLMSILWYAVGYSLAFSEGTPLYRRSLQGLPFGHQHFNALGVHPGTALCLLPDDICHPDSRAHHRVAR